MLHLFLLWFLWFISSTNFGFCFSSFLSCFSYTIKFFEIFLVSWGKLALLYTSPLEMLLLCPISFGSECFHCHLFLGVCFFFFFFSPLWFIQWSTGCLVAYHLASTWQHGKESICQCKIHRRCRFNPWVRKIFWSRKWQPTPIFLPGKFHGQRSLVDYSPWRWQCWTGLSMNICVLGFCIWDLPPGGCCQSRGMWRLPCEKGWCLPTCGWKCVFVLWWARPCLGAWSRGDCGLRKSLGSLPTVGGSVSHPVCCLTWSVNQHWSLQVVRWDQILVPRCQPPGELMQMNAPHLSVTRVSHSHSLPPAWRPGDQQVGLAQASVKLLLLPLVPAHTRFCVQPLRVKSLFSQSYRAPVIKPCWPFKPNARSTPLPSARPPGWGAWCEVYTLTPLGL